MNSPIKKIGLILVVIFLLPSIFYSVYELSSLNKNEAIIEEIYNNQLDAILYSVNQYSDDVSSGWASWYFYNGEKEKSRKVIEEILDGRSWNSFGYIAAESDMIKYFGN